MPFRSEAEEAELLKTKIESLRRKHDAVILAHNYQVEEIQAIADFVGDSFGLSRQAAQTDAEVVVFCGVRFMAESAAILAPEKVVLLPELQAGCPLADAITREDLVEMKARYPQAQAVSYVNSSAEVKAESDICCTSSNAVQVVNALESEEIIFVPDANLADWVSRHTDKRVIPWAGHCSTHNRVLFSEFEAVRHAHPRAKIAVHPECRPEIAARADYVGSTAGIIRFARETDAGTVVIGTEMGVIPQIKRENPDKNIFLLSPKLICYNMKLTSLQKVCTALETLQPRIEVAPGIQSQAARALQRMLDVV